MSRIVGDRSTARARLALFVALAACIVLTTLGTSAVRATPTQAQVPVPGGPPVVFQSAHNDTSPPLRAMVARSKVNPVPGPNREIGGPDEIFGEESYADNGPKKVDPVLQTKTTGRSPEADLSFEGITNNDNQAIIGFKVAPPDTNGEVGPNHYVQTVNLLFEIFDKEGNSVLGPAKQTTLWTGFGGPCETRDDGDPIVNYDQLADRWVISQFAIPGPYYMCFAVSQTPDPTGPYYRYSFNYGSIFVDYPKVTVWPDAYYASFHLFDAATGLGAAAYDRAAMLAGNPAMSVFFAAGAGTHGGIPSDLEGTTLPPAGAPNLYVEPKDAAQGMVPTDRLHLWELHADWTTPSNSTFTLAGFLETESWDGNMCGYARSCIAQKGSGTKIDALGRRAMFRVMYRNFGWYQSWVVNHTVDADGTDHAGVRWYELRDFGSGIAIAQQSTWAPDSHSRWMASINQDRDANIAIGYSVSSKDIYPGIRFTAHSATNAAGQMLAESSLAEGGGTQEGVSRWGDYSALTIDPLDDCTFWYTTEYNTEESQGGFGWTTRIGTFKMPLCGVRGPYVHTYKTADSATAPMGTEDGYTITLANSAAAAVTIGSIVDTLPVGFGYVPGSSTGATTSDPGIAGQTLTWSGPFSVASGATLTLHFNVNVSAVPGTYFNNATATAVNGPSVVPSGNTAPITVTSPLLPRIRRNG